MKMLIVRAIHVYKKIEPLRQFCMKIFIGQSGFECMFQPTCSEYTELAVQKYGAIKGLRLGFLRILRCRPGSKGGFDPVPKTS